VKTADERAVDRISDEGPVEILAGPTSATATVKGTPARSAPNAPNAMFLRRFLARTYPRSDVALPDDPA
jgi:hypothetical protein